METSLHYDPSQKHLSFLLKERVTADPDIQLRFRGRLNTTAGAFDYHATAHKIFSTGPAIKVCATAPFCPAKPLLTAQQQHWLLTACNSRLLLLWSPLYCHCRSQLRSP
eukprot:GHRR01030678.1.p2 GENE.GHRR01030678.1~~GHRR01030678.1.p2  ORF type:complete len:109 (-),score=21.54 GHRR01030678.1:197-523(-)